MRAVAFNVMLIAGVSTLLFNGNPLLRFDGYYILADLIEIPNLAQRANRYLGYLVERYLFGHARRRQPGSTRAASALAVRLCAVLSLRLPHLASCSRSRCSSPTEFFFIGVLLAICGAVVDACVLPLVKGVSYLLTQPRLRAPARRRAMSVSARAVAGLVGAVLLVPMPLRDGREGVVWMPEEAEVRAGADGFVAAVVAQPGSEVRRGDAADRMDDPVLAAAVARARGAAGASSSCATSAVRFATASQAEIVRGADREHGAASSTRCSERRADLIVRSRAERALRRAGRRTCRALLARAS